MKRIKKLHNGKIIHLVQHEIGTTYISICNTPLQKNKWFITTEGNLPRFKSDTFRARQKLCPECEKLYREAVEEKAKKSKSKYYEKKGVNITPRKPKLTGYICENCGSSHICRNGTDKKGDYYFRCKSCFNNVHSSKAIKKNSIKGYNVQKKFKLKCKGLFKRNYNCKFYKQCLFLVVAKSYNRLSDNCKKQDLNCYACSSYTKISEMDKIEQKKGSFSYLNVKLPY